MILGCVDMVYQPGALDRCSEVFHFDEVPVADEQGDNIVRVVSEPVCYLFQVALQGAGVKQITRAVAEIDGSIHLVRLELDW